MAEQKETSRTPIIDIVENIGETIAIQSHLSELYTSTVHEVDVNLDENEDLVYMAEKEEELKEMKKEYEAAYKRRKMLMGILRDMWENTNMDYRCLVKHSIASRQYSKELRDTDRNNLDYETLYIQASEYMYSVLSHFLGVEVVKCWRCLLDAMSE